MLAMLAGCSTESLLFSTKTSVGIDLSATNGAPRLNLGYDRTEAAIVPAKPDGGTHSVLGGLDADLSMNEVRIKQLFATGQAAQIAASHAQAQGQDRASAAQAAAEAAAGKGRAAEKAYRPIVFATDASFSLINIQLQNNGLPGSGSTLYRRSEATLIPIQPGQVEAASVYADISIDTNGKDKNPPTAPHSWVEDEVGQHPTRFSTFGVRIVQSIATGAAAERLVARPDIRDKLHRVMTGRNPGFTDAEISRLKVAMKATLNNQSDRAKIMAFFNWVQVSYPDSKAGDYTEGPAGDFFNSTVNPRLASDEFLIVNNKANELFQ